MRTIISLALLLTVASLLAIHASADPVQPYLVGPEDVLEVFVTNHEELNKTVTVLEDGTITLAEVGTISVQGKTPREIAAMIKATLSRTLKLVDVAVSAKEIHSHNVRIVGVVKVPGPYEIRPDWRVMDLIDIAGGPTQKWTHILGRIVRNRIQIIPLDLQKADSKRDSDANVLLMRDDLLILDEIEVGKPQVFVLGCVTKPGAYDLDDQTTVLSVLTQAGGPTEKASLSTAHVTRNGKDIPLNLSDTAKGKMDAVAANFKFVSGDVLFIPESLIHFAVMGQVVKPGLFPVPESGSITVLDALNLAGGSNGGNLAKADVIRTVDGKQKEIPVNIDKMLKKGDMTGNIMLHADDLLFIPVNNAHPFVWSNLLLPITALSLMGLRF